MNFALLLFVTFAVGYALGQALHCPSTITLSNATVETSSAVVAIADEWAAIGYPSAERGDGRIEVYQTDTTTLRWNLVAQLPAPEGTGEAFGSAIAISPRLGLVLLIVGAPNAKNGQGAVFVYTASFQSPKFTLNATVSAPSAMAFGQSVGLGIGSPKSKSGKQTLVVGAPQSNNGDGAAYIFFLYGVPLTWELSLVIDSPETMTGLGSSVSISHSGTLVAIGVPSTTVSLGSVFIFSNNLSSSQWNQWGGFKGFSKNDGFGSTISIGGSIADNGNFDFQDVLLAVGMPGSNSLWFYAWSTFACNDSNGCVVYNQTIAMPEVPSFGYHVALDHNFPGGLDAVVATAPQSENQTVFALLYKNGWSSPYEVNATLVPNALWKGRDFGSSVAFSNGTALIGGIGGAEFWCTGIPLPPSEDSNERWD